MIQKLFVKKKYKDILELNEIYYLPADLAREVSQL